MLYKVLLLICFLGFGSLAFSQSSKKWEKEIQTFEQADSLHLPPRKAVLFTGSSSIRGWKNLQSNFPSVKVINRGFGGSEIADANYYFDRLITKYKPKTVVFYAGDNDISAGKSPETVFDDFIEFAQKLKQKLPKTKLIYLSIKPSQARWELYPKMEEVNKRIAAYAETEKNIVFVDVSTPMLKNGTPDSSLFLADGLHMNEKGYKLWNEILQPYIKK